MGVTQRPSWLNEHSYSFCCTTQQRGCSTHTCLQCVKQVPDRRCAGRHWPAGTGKRQQATPDAAAAGGGWRLWQLWR